MKYIIKPMETHDEINGKAYVHYKSWHETYKGLIADEHLKKITEELCRSIANIWPDNLLVAKDGDRVIGFAGYGKHQDNTLSDCGEVYSLYVLSDYHGQKVGYELMNAAIEKLTDYKRIAVWVLKGNDRAINFYKRYGFRFDGTERKTKPDFKNSKLRMIFERNKG